MVEVRPWPSVLVLVGLAACSFTPAGGGDDQPDATDDRDDAGTIDSPPADTDHDGILDEDDNCPAAPNPDQRDHDGDALGDPCDPCPQIAASMTGGDSDDDGVGDACDPRPGLPDRISWFEGLYDAPTTWNLIGPWSHDPAGALQVAPAEIGARFALADRQVVPPLVVETRFTIDAVAPRTTGESDVRQAGVVFASTADATRFYLCAIRATVSLTPGPTRVVTTLFEDTTQVVSTATSDLQGQLAAGSTAVVSGVSSPAPGQGCRGSLDGEPGQASLPDGTNPGLRIGVRTFGLAAHFHYLIVYQPAS